MEIIKFNYRVFNVDVRKLRFCCVTTKTEFFASNIKINYQNEKKIIKTGNNGHKFLTWAKGGSEVYL
jgi:hypothetical protein